MAKAHEGGKGRGAPVYNPKAKLDPSQMTVSDEKPWRQYPPVTLVAKGKRKKK